MSRPMPQKGSSRKGMRRRSKVTTSGSDGESSSADGAEDHVDANEVRSYLYDVVKLAKEKESDATFRVEGSLPEKEAMVAETTNKIPSSLQKMIVDEAQWANSHQIKRQAKGLWRWGFGVLCLLVSSLFLAHYLSVPDVEEKPQGYFLDENFDDNLYDQAVEALMSDQLTHSKALQCIEQFLKAKSWEEAEPLLRDSPTLRMNLRSHWKPCESRPDLRNDEQLTIDYGHTEKMGFYIIEGRCMDNSPFLYYFVQAEGVMKLDWEASEALGDVSVDDLVRYPLKEPTAMRVVVERSPYYLLDLNEKDFESFRLTVPGEAQVFWGYAERGSPQHTALEKILQQGGVLSEGNHSCRAKVQLSPIEENAVSKRFIISEIIHPNWVSP
jgi:hypothetical protein